MAVDAVDPKSEITEYKGPISSYQVLEPKPLASDARFVAADLRAEENGEAPKPKIRPVPKAPAPKRFTKPAAESVAAVADQPSIKSSTRMVMALGVGLGILGAVAMVAFVLLPGKSSDTSYDMGPVTSTNTGLKGHLVTNWGNRLDYKLTIEPSDPSQLDAFVTAIQKPKEPISVNLQLKDVSGKVLCDTPILLRFDPLQNMPNVVTQNNSAQGATKKNAKVDETAENQAEIERSLSRARLVSQELSREHGKDIFQTVNGDDGQVASLAAQGTMPCTKKQYQNAATWAFVTNFPSILQPSVQQENTNLTAFGGDPQADRDKSSSQATQKATRKIALPASHFSVEQDDVLVGYQARTGIAETRGGKSFLLEKPELVASSLKGVDFPIPIHYRCDQLGACSLAGVNLGIQRAWLEK